jgi:tetratricopeptide (TPR) repeat protein
MKTTPISVSAAVLAALLLVTPPAGAASKTAKHRKNAAPKMSPEVRRLMSEGLGDLQRGEYTAAITSLTKAVQAKGTVSTYFLLGWAHYQRGFKQGAVETADRDDAQSAIDAYGMAISLDPKLRALPDPARLYFSLALCDEAVESYDKSLEAYKSALRLAPNKALIPLNAARLRLKMKDPEKAMSNLAMAIDKADKAGKESALIAAVQNDPVFAPILADRAMRRMLGVAAPAQDGTMVASNDSVRGEDLRDSVSDGPSRVAAPAQDPAVLDKIAQGNLEFKFRRFQNAVADFNEALSINSERLTLSADQIADLYEKIGTSYNKLGSAEQAVRSLQKSLQQNPMNAGAHYQIALAYAMDGQTAAALHALKESFDSTGDPAELRRLVLLSKTDVELEAVRDLPGFAQLSADVADRVALR